MKRYLKTKCFQRYFAPLFLGPAVLFLFILPPELPAQESTTNKVKASQAQDEPIKLFARNQEKKGEVVLASGDVELHFRDIVLLAEEIQLNTSTYEVIASGHVTLQHPSEIISCDRLIYNLKTREGKLDNVLSIARPNLLFGANAVVKNTDDLYEMKQGWLTNCTQPVPRWSFSVARANLKPDDYISLWSAVVKIKKIPVFYLPYMRYPLKERATGFLFPKVGFTKVKGLSISESFYWAIAPNMDATITADFYTNQGVGGGAEFRYLLGKETKGEASVYYFRFFNKSNIEDMPKKAHLIRWEHQQVLPGGFRLDGEIDYSSSFDFLREFENNFSYGTSSNRSHSISLSKSWSLFSFNVRTSRFETYFPQSGQSSVSSYLPQASFNLMKFKVYRSVFFSWQSGYVNQVYSYTRYDKTTNTYKNAQAFFKPKLNLPIMPFPWLNLNLSAGGNLIYYFQTYSPGTTVRVDEPMLITQKTAEVKLEGPSFYKIYFRGNEPYLKHLIEPYVSYSYESSLSADQASRIISPFGFMRYNQVTYGLNQDFIIKTDSAPKQILTVGISQTYYFDPPTSEIKRYYPNQLDRHYAPVNFLVRFYPLGNFKLDVSADYNTYEKNIMSIRLSPVYGQPEDNYYFSLNWSKSYYMMGPDSIFWNNQAGLQAGFCWPEKLDLKIQMQRDLKRKKQIYNGLSAIYHYQCLDFVLDLRMYYYRSKPDTQFKFSIRLGNISQSTDLLGAFGF